MVVGELDELVAAAGRLVDVESWSCSDAELLESLPRLEKLARLVSAASVTVTAQVDQRGLAGERGYASTGTLLAHALRLSGGEARERERLSRAVTLEVQPSGDVRPARLPATAEVLRAGEVSLAHVRVIARTIGELPVDVDASVVAQAESFLAEQACHLDPRRLAAVAATLRARLDQDGTLAAERDAVAERELFFAHDHLGRIVFRGRLDAEAGSAFQTVIDALAAPSPAVEGERDARSPARRRADALVALVDRALAQGDLPSSGGERPQVTVTIGHADLAAATGSATLGWGEVISAGAARRIACDAKILPVVLGSRSEPLDVGRASYVVPQPMRRALVVRDGGCGFPGCDRLPGWSQAHHIRHWAEGGETKLDNLVLLCGHHHRVVHHDDWDVRINHGQPEFLPPPWLDPAREPRRNTRTTHLTPTG